MAAKVGTIFKPGQSVPQSGIYDVLHDPIHAKPHQVTCVYGEPFPPCNHCGRNVRFKLCSRVSIVREACTRFRLEPAKAAVDNFGSPAAVRSQRKGWDSSAVIPVRRSRTGENVPLEYTGKPLSFSLDGVFSIRSTDPTLLLCDGGSSR